MNHERHPEAGMALLYTMLAMLVIGGAALLVSERVISEKRSADRVVSQAVVDEAAKAGIDIAIERVWNDYVQTSGNTTGNLASFVVYANSLVDNNEDLNYNGVRDEEEFDFNGNGAFDTGDPLVLASEDNPLDLAGGAQITNLTLARTDDVTGSAMRIRSTAEFNGQQRTAEQTIRVSGERFHGFEYGILANNINCILCHAKFYSLDVDRNMGDPDTFGEHDRIKVAALESLMIRTNENIDSKIAGTLYTRGQIYDQTGDLMTGSEIQSAHLDGFQFDSTNGKLMQDEFGNMTETNMSPGAVDSDGYPEQFANLYMDYPSDPDYMTDGDLPSKFPAPFPDDNDNRVVDNDELDRVLNASNGTIEFSDPDDLPPGIQGGVAFGVPHGETFDGTGMPTTSNEARDVLAGTDPANRGKYDGNLILVGTDADPIQINEQVAVTGDLLIQGKVKGWGQLLVKGNVYVMGDVTYDDAPGEFGIAEDGTVNGLAVSAGGSIMMGDYLTIRGKMNPSDTSKYPSGGWIDTRTETKTGTVKDGYEVAYGYFDPGASDKGYPYDNGVDGVQPQFSFTTSEIMLFNEMEYQRAEADPNYLPRYFRLNPDAPVYRYVGNDEHATRYTEAGVVSFVPEGDYALHDLNPTDWWITDDQLRQIWFNDEMTRPESGRPWQFDGLLYSNNSIFGIVRSSNRHKSNTQGRMIIRGSIIAAELGMLVPGPDFSVPRQALDLYYDKRVNNFFRVEDTSQVEFTRTAFNWVGIANKDKVSFTYGGDAYEPQSGGGEDEQGGSEEQGGAELQ